MDDIDIVDELRAASMVKSLRSPQLCDLAVAINAISARDAEIKRLRALITEWDAARGCTAARTRQWDEGDWYRAEVRLGAAEGALIEEARRG